jgi:predicted  nucleic acid-binding Zn-ribbon protein
LCIRGDADAELVGDATEEIKRLREQLIEREDEIRDLRYRIASARLQSDAVVKVVVPTPMP